MGVCGACGLCGWANEGVDVDDKRLLEDNVHVDSVRLYWMMQAVDNRMMVD